MADRDTLALSAEPDNSFELSRHRVQDSLDSDLGRLSEAIFQKRIELENEKNADSNMFTLNDSPNFIQDVDITEVERLEMRLEDMLSHLTTRNPYLCEGFLNAKLESVYGNYMPRHSNFDFSQSLENITSNYIECSLMDLYQLVENGKKIISQVESQIKFRGRLILGNFKLDIKVIVEDSPLVEKNLIAEGFFSEKNVKKQKAEMRDFAMVDEYFKNMEKNANFAMAELGFDEISDGTLRVGQSDKEKHSEKNYIMMELEYAMLNKMKIQEEIRIKELEWQGLQVKLKKSSYFNRMARMNAREEELRKFSKGISEETVKNAKERQALEEECELLDQKIAAKEAFYEEKIEFITKVLQEIEDSKAEPHDTSRINRSHVSRVYDSPSITEEIPLDTQIKDLELELRALEIEYKKSKVPETLESIQTSITRVKSSLLNLQSLKAIKKNERTSSALRSTIQRVEKHWENSAELPTNSRTGSSNNDSNQNRFKKGPGLPSRSNIMLSPLRKLEVKTAKLDVSTLNSPSRRQSPFFRNDNSHADVETKKYLRKKEEVLREREAEIVNEEKKLQEVWKNLPEGKEMIPVIQFEMFEYRKLRQELYQKNEILEREKTEWRERHRNLVSKENELQLEKQKYKELVDEFELKKGVIGEKLEWLKKKLSQNECN